MGLEIKKVELEYQGTGVSLNEWYSSKHWSNRYKIKKRFAKIFQAQNKIYYSTPETPEINRMTTYKIELKYNSRIDPSNTIAMVKLWEDFLVKKGIIKNDSKTQCKEIRIRPDQALKHNTYFLKLKREL